MQLIGATLAALFLRAVIDVSATYGSNYPAAGYSAGDAFLMEAVLTLGLVSVILGTASGAQNIGIFGAIGVGAYIALAGLWGSPISGASMNPARTFGPDLVGTDFTELLGLRRRPARRRSCSRSGRPGCCEEPAAAAPARPPRRATCTPRSSTPTRLETAPGAGAAIRDRASRRDRGALESDCERRRNELDKGFESAPGMNRTCARGLGTSLPKRQLQGKQASWPPARQKMRQRSSEAARLAPSFRRMRDLPSGTVTLVFTDIEGSTSLMTSLGDEYADVLAEHRRILRDAFTKRGGIEVDTQGDAFFYAFTRAGDAVEAASEGQDGLAEGPVRVRIGVHTGEPLVAAEGYVGIDVHRAARIAAAAHGGQVVISQTTRDLVDSDPGLRDLGVHRLKDLTAPERLYQLGDTEFPPLRTLDATNLPVTASPLLGREQELEQLVTLLTEGPRLVTVTGPGGTGKTRLALQVAAELVGTFLDGVFWVPLAGLTDPELVLPEIARMLPARDDLLGYLRGKQQLLLLLDNFEHLLAAAPDLASLLTASTGCG